MPLRSPGIAALSLDDKETMRPTLQREDSFDVSLNDTFSAADLRVRGTQGIQDGDAGTISNLSLADLERGKQLGRGASGRVYLMRHRIERNRVFALKELQTLTDTGARHQAVNELKIARTHQARTDHVVQLIDAFFDDGKLSVLMEYCEGGSLQDALKAVGTISGVKPLPIDAVTVQILRGLQVMHREMKQVHRDLKPANVLMSSDGTVKLSDFGISKQLDGTEAVAVTQVGSTAYMAPERLTGDEYSYPSDVWAVGVIVLETLRGQHPYPPSQHRGFLSIFNAICRDAHPPPPEGTPSEVVEAVDACLSKEPASRPSVAALLEGSWLGPFATLDVRKPVFGWLVTSSAAITKHKARAMAARAIATSEQQPEATSTSVAAARSAT